MFKVNWLPATTVLLKDRRVIAAWVFGSAQGGGVRPGSDLDLALLFGAPPSLDDRADLRAELQEALGFEEIDLLVLNQATSLVTFEAVSGRRLFCRDEEACAAFVSRAAREYEDELAFAGRGIALLSRCRKIEISDRLALPKGA